MTVTANTQKYIEDQASFLTRFAGQIFREAHLQSDNPLLEPELSADPLLPAPFAEAWGQVFKAAGPDANRKLGTFYGRFSKILFETEADAVCTAIYPKVEEWLNTYTTQPPRERTKCSPAFIWALAAVHNGLWFCRQNPAGESDAGEEGEVQRQRDLEKVMDPVVRRLLSESDLQVGDLIALHLILIRMWNLLVLRQNGSGGKEPSPGADSELGYTPGDAVRVGVSIQTAAKLSEMNLFSPISRLARTGSVDPAEMLLAWPSWPRIDKILADSGASGVRQYLVSKIGPRLAQPDADPERIRTILETLDSVDRYLIDPETKPTGRTMNAWRRFVARILLDVLNQWQTDSANVTWSRWCEGYPDITTLAQWLGRLAFRAEDEAGKRRPHQYTGLVWYWGDLAKMTLRPWIARPGFTTVCVGLWLDGYLNNIGGLPQLRMAHRMTDLTLERLASHWEGALARELDGRDGYTPVFEDREDRIELLKTIKERLRSNPRYAELTSDISIFGDDVSIPASESDRERSIDEEPADEPMVTIRQYRSQRNDDATG